MLTRDVSRALVPFLFVLIVVFSIGPAWAEKHTPKPPPRASEEEVLYTCGMHPQVIQKGPGRCPICGMELVPLRKKSQSGRTIIIDPAVVQNMGVRLARVSRGSLTHSIRTIGLIQAPEDRTVVVNLRFSGWVERLFADETGQFVKKGERLLEIYSPELLTAQEEYLLALKRSGPKGALAQAAARRLRLLGVPEEHLQKIRRRGRALETVVIRAPISGFILEKKIFEGDYVPAGSDLFRLADLTQVWVRAEVYEQDVPWIRMNQMAVLKLSYHPGRVWMGRLSFIYPSLNEKTRTLGVRLTFKNQDLALLPGMFATVQIKAPVLDDVLIIPEEAVIPTGQRDVVFVAEGQGRFSLREIVTGLTGDGGLVEVREGLKEGELVVLSGQFLLDSESKLKEAAGKFMGGHQHGGSPGGPKDSQDQDKTSPKKHQTSSDSTGIHQGGKETGGKETPPQASSSAETYWTCPMHPEVVKFEPGECPICGMDLVEKKVGAEK